LALSVLEDGFVLGTAMPETLVPIVALPFGGEVDREAIGIGAIVGAPFMLSTLAFFITGLAIFVYARKGRRTAAVLASPAVMKRDLEFFILVYVLVVLAGVVDLGPLKYFSPPGSLLSSLTFGGKAASDPALALVELQLVVALAAIIGGAKVFVSCISLLSGLLGVPAFILAVVITLIATELTEKVNSVMRIPVNPSIRSG
jgi:cation:H+ antiporter